MIEEYHLLYVCEQEIRSVLIVFVHFLETDIIDMTDSSSIMNSTVSYDSYKR